MRKERIVRRVSVSLWQSLKKAVVTDPEVRRLLARHPVLVDFLRRRFSVRHFSGLPLTLLTIAFLYTLGLFFGLVEDLIRNQPLVAVDVRLAHLLFVLRNPNFVRLFLWITLLGTWYVVIAFAAVASMSWWLRQRREFIVPLWLALVGGQVITFIGKLSLHRPRPEGLVPVYIEQSFSFPSGHATVATVLYGFFIYYLFCTSRSWKNKLVGLAGGIALIVAIGFSRLYLGVHFLSDVLSGYLLGFLCLLLAISLVEWRRSRHPQAPPRPLSVPGGRAVSLLLWAALLGWYVVAAGRYTPLFTNAVGVYQPQIVETGTVVAAFEHAHLSKFTETLAGNWQEPLSFIVLAHDDQQLVAAFAAAGWYRAEPISFRSLSQIVTAALFKRGYQTAPMTPSFWNSEVHDFGFEKPTTTNLVKERHHARFWRTTLRTTDGERVYVGTASFDTSLKWLVTHHIQPDIDTERDRLLSDLKHAGVVAEYQYYQFVTPTLGKNFSGDVFFTDGELYTVAIKE